MEFEVSRGAQSTLNAVQTLLYKADVTMRTCQAFDCPPPPQCLVDERWETVLTQAYGVLQTYVWGARETRAGVHELVWRREIEDLY